ncbi:hypothetical protein GGR56DRAFT_696265 [Xylariaceae sp. FL0804]|nr:hypothetical protein GGR56DRAFT_696265 [Xylariaceae sp. FL0804]
MTWGPFWLFLFLGFSVYAVDYMYSWSFLMADMDDFGYDFVHDNNKPGGFVLLVLSAILKFGWFGSWMLTLGQHWWQWPLFWIQPERVVRYGDYPGDRDLPFNREVLRVQSEILMDFGDGPRNSEAVAAFEGVTVDRIRPPSAAHVQGAGRRQQLRLGASRRVQQRSSGVSSAHDESAADPGTRRRTGRSTET